MLNACRPCGRLSYCLIFVIAMVAVAGAAADAPVKTLISDVIYRADGTPAAGTLVISWGQSQLARDAYNYFGIKAHGQHRLIELPTTEVVNGKVVRTAAYFAAYDSMAACFADRDQLIMKLACYAEARACAGDPAAFIRTLAKHWATDPHYADKLTRIYTQNGWM
jgi:uncharacterized FlgJ-related protein